MKNLLNKTPIDILKIIIEYKRQIDHQKHFKDILEELIMSDLYQLENKERASVWRIDSRFFDNKSFLICKKCGNFLSSLQKAHHRCACPINAARSLLG